MRQEKTNIFFGIDWLIVILYAALVGFGWINIYAASYTNEDISIINMSTKYGKQLLWILLSIPLIIFTLFFSSKFIEKYSSLFYLFSVLTLVGLFFFGKEINGAKSWYDFGVMSLQPSEFVKIFTALALAKLLSDRKYNLDLIKNQIKAFIVIFTPAILIGIYDPGTAIIFLSFFFVLNREGLTLKYIFFGVISISLFLLTILFGVLNLVIATYTFITLLVIYIAYKNRRFLRFNILKVFAMYVLCGLFIVSVDFSYKNVLKQHHRDRFEILLGQKKDIKKIGYNTNQSLQTISSGRLYGKGFLKGDKTKGKFVPEQHTDYIFSVVGEEWGFIGSSLVIIIYMSLLFRILYLSETHTNKFGRIYGYGIASILFFHLIVNVGMVIGLLPTIGIPLPFFSYGGSSLWAFTLLLFVFIKLDANKSYDL